ncbi:hypothetical protein BRADI_2g00767v3 [Brachypodium distachyon]|uniref:Uncharacterized protein n=1 Tax=Brachypodium distachyon TaxID=15368 RepID=A0A0Q3QLG8_BRADI|nr:hypothetical protein BRADI_2g00767v3 [Brachypodium distachyon]
MDVGPLGGRRAAGATAGARSGRPRRSGGSTLPAGGGGYPRGGAPRGGQQNFRGGGEMGGKRTERTTRESPGCSTTNENQALGPALQIRD